MTAAEAMPSPLPPPQLLDAGDGAVTLQIGTTIEPTLVARVPPASRCWRPRDSTARCPAWSS